MTPHIFATAGESAIAHGEGNFAILLAAPQGRLLAYQHGEKLHAADLRTGALRWSAPTGASANRSSSSDDSKLVALPDLDGDGVADLRTYVADRMVYVLSGADGHLLLQISNEDHIETIDTSAMQPAQPLPPAELLARYPIAAPPARTAVIALGHEGMLRAMPIAPPPTPWPLPPAPWRIQLKTRPSESTR